MLEKPPVSHGILTRVQKEFLTRFSTLPDTVLYFW